MKRVGKEDKDGNRKVAGPPVDAHLQPPADRVAIQHDAQEPARRKHPRDTLLRSASKASSSAWLVFSPPVCRRPPVDRAHAAPVRLIVATASSNGKRRVPESNRNTSVERPAAAWAERTKCEVSARG